MTIAKGVGEMMADSAMTTVYAAKEHAGRRINQAERNARQKIDKVSGQIKDTKQFKQMEKKARRIARSASDTDIRKLSQQAMLQGRQFSESEEEEEDV